MRARTNERHGGCYTVVSAQPHVETGEGSCFISTVWRTEHPLGAKRSKRQQNKRVFLPSNVPNQEQ